MFSVKSQEMDNMAYIVNRKYDILVFLGIFAD